MTAGEFLVLLAQAVLLLLAAWKLVDLVRVRGRARLDLELLLLSLAIPVVIRLLEQRAGWSPGPLRHAAPLAVVVHPLLLLRLVDHFRPVPRWIAVAIGLGVLASWGLWLYAPAGSVAVARLGVAAVFTLSLLYGARALVGSARHAQGVVRRRIGLVGAGATCLAGIAVVLGTGVARPGWAAELGSLVPALMLAVALCYALGLAPPPWLSRSWQQADVQQFLRTSSGAAGESTDRSLTRLCQTARHAVGGQAAVLARWNEARGRLELELRGERALVGGPLPAGGLVARQWTFRRPFVADRRAEVRQACLRMAPGLDCDAILGVPLVTPTHVWGLLLVFLRRSPVLPAEDLRLLSLLAEHTAVILDYAALVEKLRRENAALRGEAAPEEPDNETD